IDQVMARANRISVEVAARRDEFHLETPWPTLTRLIHDYLGIRFAEPMAELELAFWRASVTTTPMPGAREALEQFHQSGLRLAVVSNCAFSQDVLRYELGKHGLADRLEFIVVSAEYSVRKPNPLLFETAAARLGVACNDIWFVGDRLDTDVTGAKAAGMKAVWFQSGDLSVRLTGGGQGYEKVFGIPWRDSHRFPKQVHAAISDGLDRQGRRQSDCGSNLNRTDWY